LKISLVIPSFYPAVVYGGTIFSSLNASKELAKSGHQIFVSTTNTNMYSRLDVETNKFIELDSNLFVKYYNETIVDRLSLPLFWGVKKDIAQADIVHIQAIFNTPTPIALYYASRLNKPILLSPRGVLGNWIMNHGIKFKQTWLNLFIKPYAEKVWWHATSEQEKEEILLHYPTAKVIIIPNGIHLEEFHKRRELTKKEYCQKFGFNGREPSHIIVSMGRLHKKKGFDILIDAFSLLKKDYPDSVLLIAGQDEGEKEKLEDQIERSGFSNDIKILQPVLGDDKITFLSNADVFVLPSHNENFGNVYAEALAAGTPVIASKNTPWREVEEAACGKWIENTAEANVVSLKELLGQDRNALRKNSINFIQSYNWENISEKFVHVFELMLRNEQRNTSSIDLHK
jgi:glycosyltransferase involved in cell wall biosynthesis